LQVHDKTLAQKMPVCLSSTQDFSSNTFRKEQFYQKVYSNSLKP